MLPLLALGSPVAAFITALLLPLTAVAGGGPDPGTAPPDSLAADGAATVGSAEDTRRSGWAAPLDPPVVVLGPFDPPPEPWLPGHRGVDLDAEPGRPVRAAGAGTVTWASPLAGRGVVVVEHAGGLRTTYEPVDALVSVGDRVERGELLGVVGEGHVHCGGVVTCLHWGLRRGRDYLDPWRLLHPGRAVLLPP